MRKSYKGLAVWVVLYCAGFIPFIGLNLSGHTISKLSLLYTTCAITLLAYIIYKTDSIYWYNGISFEEAEMAGYERRMEYAYRHLQAFGRFSVIYALFAAASLYLNFNIIADVLFLTFGLIFTAISTMKIKL